ncbi:MAG: IS110 family transposase [Anaerolineae bacterium]
MSIVYYGGLDVHQKTIVAFFFCPETGDCWEEEVPNDRIHLLRAVSRWRRRGELRVCYEASGAGFVLKRWLDEVDVPCDVVASAFIPRGPGDRVKTDRRDARKLAQLYAAGLLRTVRVPSEEEETVRALVRHRDDLTRDMTRMKNRILKFLGLQGLRYTEGKNWTKRHRQWLHDLRLEPLQRIVLQDHLANLEGLERQRAEVDRKIAEIAEMPPYREPVLSIAARMCTTRSRVMCTTHRRLDVYHPASVAACYDDSFNAFSAGKAEGVPSYSFLRLRWR